MSELSECGGGDMKWRMRRERREIAMKAATRPAGWLNGEERWRISGKRSRAGRGLLVEMK